MKKAWKPYQGMGISPIPEIDFMQKQLAYLWFFPSIRELKALPLIQLVIEFKDLISSCDSNNKNLSRSRISQLTIET